MPHDFTDEDRLGLMQAFQAQERHEQGVETMVLSPVISWPLALPVFCFRFLKYVYEQEGEEMVSM